MPADSGGDRLRSATTLHADVLYAESRQSVCGTRSTAGTTVVADKRSSECGITGDESSAVALFRCGRGEFGGPGAEIVQQILAWVGGEEDRKAAEQQDAKQQDATEYP